MLIIELYALDGEYIETLNSIQSQLGATVRGSLLSRAHAMLIQAGRKMAPHAAYLDAELARRIAALFADLSKFMADGALDRKRLDELSLEKGLISAPFRTNLTDR